MNTEIVKVQTALTEFEKIETGLADLRAKYGNVVFAVETKDGLKNAIEARRAVRTPRVETEKIRKEAKAPILELGRQLDAKAKYITEELMKIEIPIDVQIQAEQTRKEREIFEENQRIIGIKESIHNLELVPAQMAGKSAAEISKRVDALQAYDLTEWAAEFIAEAEKARAQALTALQQLMAGAAAQEIAAQAEAAKVAQERAELARLRAEQEERNRTEQARIAEETRARAEAEAKARAQIEAEQRASREKIEAEERAARQAREAEEAKLKAERDRLDAERREVEAQQRKEREAAEAAQREIQRQQNELLDARVMLQTFKERFGHLRQFAGVVKAIDALQKKAA